MPRLAIGLFSSLMAVMPLHNAQAVELLSATELASHCQSYPTDRTSIDGEFCARYIQGFIDGAVATDARVMLNVEAEKNGSSFTDRAMKTRVLSRTDYQRAAKYAEFCLGDPVPLQAVVMNVVADINGLQVLEGSARDLVYSSLKKHYPCDSAK